MPITESEAQALKNLMMIIKPTIDKEVGTPIVEQKVSPFMHRAVKEGQPMIPNVSRMTDEEKAIFNMSAGAQYLNNLIFTIQQVHMAMTNGDFDVATVHADFIWVHYPDLRYFLDTDPPSTIIDQRQNDYTNYKWSKYAKVDDAIMFSPDRKYVISNERYLDLKETRDRAISREYLMFEFLYRVTVGCRELGWFLTEDTRVDYTGNEEANEATAEATEGNGEGETLE